MLEYQLILGVFVMKVMKSRLYLPLPLDNGSLFLVDDDLTPQKEELESLLGTINNMNNKDFSKRVLFGQEIKSNNTIEGYNDDISLVKSVIKHPTSCLNEEQRKRILNMYRGYKYILQDKEINKDNLRELYNILSDGLLSKGDLDNMGEYYRLDPVYIFYSSILSKDPDMGIDASLLEERMNILLEYLNSKNNFSCMTDYFIRSQIAHFYFVYLHPYYDINGRTARTTAMWYLINKEVYPYIIFNRAIQLDKNTYYTVIRDGRRFHNVTYFLNYMLKNTLIELEKEYTMEMITDNAMYELTDGEIQTLYYILSMKSNLTYFDFCSFYNHLNSHKKPTDIKKEVILPLLEKGIILEGRKSKNDDNNFFTLNPKLVSIEEKNKHLSLEQKI